MAPAPAPGPGLWQWFAGGSAGYLSDLDSAMFGVHAGARYAAPGAPGTHALFLQVGFTQDDASYFFTPAPGITGGRTERATIDLDIIPITLNYKYQAPISGALHWFVGAGVGVAILDSSLDWSWTQAVAPPFGQGWGSEDRTDVRLYGEVFAGMAFAFTDSVEMYLGVRYILMDNIERRIPITNTPVYSAGIDDDVLVELGMSFTF